MEQIRVLTWNMERKKPTTPLGAAALDHLFAYEPHLAVLTEASSAMPLRGGHLLDAARLDPGMWRADERKVALWAREPWQPLPEVAAYCGADRAVAGVTETPIGTLRVLGVCIPWHLAGTRYQEPKRKAWEEHHEFLDRLERLLDGGTPFDIIAGDFNQLRPRRWGPLHAEKRLLEVFRNYTLVTEGPLRHCVRSAGVDHIAVAANLTAIDAFGWPNVIEGRRFSDHEGAGAVLARVGDE